MENKKVCTPLLVFCLMVLFGLVSCKNVFDNSKYYFVTFSTNGGTEITKQKVKEGNRAKIPLSPEKNGYDFIGWYVDENEFDFTTKITMDITLKAKWQLRTYKINYYLDGGTNVNENPLTYTIESDDIILMDPVKQGSVFSGWLNDDEFFTVIKKGSTGDLFLTAKWDIIVLDVSFDFDNGSEPRIEKVEYGKTVTKPSNPRKPTLTFDGWYNGEIEFDFNTIITESILLKAKWVPRVGIPQEDIVTYNIGDVLLNDGTVIPYDSYNLAFTDEEKEKAIGVLAIDPSKTALTGWIGIYNSKPIYGNSRLKQSSLGRGPFEWALKQSTGYGTDFTGITCYPSEDSITYEPVRDVASVATFTGDIGGFDNWDYICSMDPAATNGYQSVDYPYPAFNYVNNYSKRCGITGKYADYWYMPSVAQLCYIYRNKDIVNKVLYALGGSPLSGKFWTSSQFGNSSNKSKDAYQNQIVFDYKGKTHQYYAWYVNMDNGFVSVDWEGSMGKAEGKSAKHYVCCMRSLKTRPRYVTELNATYDKCLKVVTLSWENPTDRDFDHVCLSYTKNGATLVSDEKVSSNMYTVNNVEPDDSKYVFTLYTVDKTGLKSVVKTASCLATLRTAGDVLLSDGTIIPYNGDDSSFTDAQKSAAVGVLYTDEKGDPYGWLGIYNTDKNVYVWAKEGSTGYNTKFDNIVCSAYLESKNLYTFIGDTNGSDNWTYICSTDSAGTSNASINYPAFDYVNKYASTYGLTGRYASGWYMPSITELYYINRNFDILNTVLNKLDGIQLKSSYWSSTQASREYESFYCSLGPVFSISDTNKSNKKNVCCVRAYK